MGAREELAAIRERAGRATTGPWKIWGMAVMADPKNTSNVDDAIDVAFTQMVDAEGKPRTFDAQFIAHARTDVPRLVEALEAVVEAHRPRPNTTSALHPEPLCTCDQEWPCPTLRAIEAALTTDTKGGAR